MAQKPHVVERQMNLVAALMKSRTGLCWRDVAGMDGYSDGDKEKTRQKRFERDLKSLNETGLVIKTHKVIGESTRYEVDRAACLLPRLSLTPEQRMMAFQFGKAYMDGGAGPLADPLSQALMKLQAGGGRTGLPDWLPKAFVKRTLNRRASEVSRLDLIGRALLEHKTINFTYQNLQGERKLRKVEPWSMVARSGGWYLVGRDVDADDSRVFRIS
ncbi:MAG: helix-turn-helix transcriptional regulator, partial [Planctomycetota bacterium]